MGTTLGVSARLLLESPHPTDQRVIGGAGAFSLPVTQDNSFAQTLLVKMVHRIAGRVPPMPEHLRTVAAPGECWQYDIGDRTLGQAAWGSTRRVSSFFHLRRPGGIAKPSQRIRTRV